MMLNWQPLGVPMGATPEAAFLIAARASHTADVVLLGWVKGAGWCGCLGVPAGPRETDPAPVIHLMNVGDVSIIAARRVERITLPERSDSDGRTGDTPENSAG